MSVPFELSQWLVPNNLAEVAGWLGMLAILAAFVSVSFGGIYPGYLYQSLNCVGSIGLIAEMMVKGARAGALLNVVWATVSALSIVRLLLFDRFESEDKRQLRELRNLLDDAYHERGYYRNYCRRGKRLTVDNVICRFYKTHGRRRAQGLSRRAG